METKVVNIHHKVPYDVYIGRGSEWGNPFSHLPSSKALYKVSTREEAVESYRNWIKKQRHLLLKLRYLKGKTLGCYCHPNLCHGHVLAEMADNYEYWEDVSNSVIGVRCSLR